MKLLRRILGTEVPSIATNLVKLLRQRFGNGERDYRLAVEAGFDRREPLIKNGPFDGMKYEFESRGSALLPKLIGSYETELQPVIELCIAHGYSRIVDIGCAEGYYAVGFAIRLKDAVVFAYDIDPLAREACLQLSGRNGCSDRVFVTGEATFQSLDAVIVPGSLIIVDCEGAETTLLDPEQLPRLRDCDILVELHPGLSDSVVEIITTRFESSHDVQLIQQQERNVSNYAQIHQLPTAKQGVFMDEFRPGWVLWGWFKRNRNGSVDS